jgi:RimJ/RimL family protein N-acetyltransferase
MHLNAAVLYGRHISMEPFEPRLMDEVRSAVDCDPQTWEIMPINPTGSGFERYWTAACGAPVTERIGYAIRRHADARVVGMSTFYTALADQGGIEIGTTFLHPNARGGPVNPESKLLMLRHAFCAGAVRVQFRVDTRNQRSQAAVTKLGAVREGVLRRDRLTWTGYIRDTVYYSILDCEWPEVRCRLEARLARYA